MSRSLAIACLLLILFGVYAGLRFPRGERSAQEAAASVVEAPIAAEVETPPPAIAADPSPQPQASAMDRRAGQPRTVGN